MATCAVRRAMLQNEFIMDAILLSLARVRRKRLHRVPADPRKTRTPARGRQIILGNTGLYYVIPAEKVLASLRISSSAPQIDDWPIKTSAARSKRDRGAGTRKRPRHVLHSASETASAVQRGGR